MTGAARGRRPRPGAWMSAADERAAWWGRPATALIAAALLVALAGAVAGSRDRWWPRPATTETILYVSSGQRLERLSLSVTTLLADVYWIRAVQQYGRPRAAADAAPDRAGAAGHRTADAAILYPLLDVATTLDPRFEAAYRVGAIFLAEAADRSDLAVTLLMKGAAANPGRWEYLHDLGFIHYWWREENGAAARWFQRASEIPGAPWWLRPLSANVLIAGGDRAGARRLWEGLLGSAGHDWVRQEAGRRLAQLDALDQRDRLVRLVATFRARTGRHPQSWSELVSRGLLPGVPLDSTGVPFTLHPTTGAVTVSADSPLQPLPERLARPATSVP